MIFYSLRIDLIIALGMQPSLIIKDFLLRFEKSESL